MQSQRSSDGGFSVEYVDTVDLPPTAMAPTYPMTRSLDTGIPPISEAREYEPNITYEYRKMTSSEIYNISPDTVLLASAASAAVTGPDLELRNLTANLREPFPYDREVTFKFELANIGTETASEVYIELLVDEQHLYTATMEDILPGYVVTVSWPVSKLDGLREIEFRAYCDLVEITYDNNFVRKSYNWEEVIDLALYSIESEEDPLDSCYHDDVELEGIGLPASITRKFIIGIANFGGEKAVDVSFQLAHNSTELGTLKLTGGIEGRKVTFLQINYGGITKYESKCIIGLRIDPNEQIEDVDRSNNIGYETFVVNYDTERFAGSIANSNALTMQVDQKCETYLAELGISRELFERAVKRWNGINANLQIKDVYWGSKADEGHNIFVTVGVVDMTPDDEHIALAVTDMYNEAGISIKGSLLTYQGQYAHVRIMLDEYTLEKYANSSQRLTVIIHEFGHAFGLKPPFCDDKTVVKASVNDPLASTTPQPHDRANINDIYM